MKTSIQLSLLLLIFAVSITAQTTNYVYPEDGYITQYEDLYVDDSGKGFAVGSCGIISGTNDDGDNWQVINPETDTDEWKMVHCPEDNCENAVFFGSEQFYYRENGDFKEAQQEEGDYRFIESIMELSNGDLIATTHNSDNFFVRSTDKGKSWTIDSLDVEKRGMVAAAPNSMDVFFFDEDKNYYHSSDGGNTFEMTGYQFPDSVNTLAEIYILNSLIAYTWDYSNREFYKTTDGGANWEILETTESYSNPRLFIPISEDLLFMVQRVSETLISEDGGVNWEPVTGLSDVFSSADSRPVCGYLGSDKLFLGGVKSAIVKSDNTYTSWTSNFDSRDEELQSLYSNNDDILVLGQENILISNDNGDSWTDITDNYPIGSVRNNIDDALFLEDGSFVLVNSFEPTIQRSTDNGETFSEWLPIGIIEKFNQTSERIVFLERGENGRIYMLSNNYIHYSDDEGANWTEISHTFNDVTLASFYVRDENRMYIGSRPYKYYYSEDAGMTWDSVTIDNQSYPRSITAFLFFDENEGLIQINSGGSQYRTTDGGDSWENDGGSIVGMHYVEEDDILYASDFASGNNGEFIMSEDRGQSFERLDYNCLPVRGGGLSSDGELYFTLAEAGYIRRHTISELVVSQKEYTEISKHELSVYPNPVNHSLSLKFQNAQSGLVQILNIEGKSIFAKKYKSQQNEFRLNVSDLQPGMYIVLWQSDNGRIYSEKFVKN